MKGGIKEGKERVYGAFKIFPSDKNHWNCCLVTRLLDISSGNSSSTSGCLSLNWFSIIAVVIITSWVFPIALSTKFYTRETEYLLNR